MAHTTAHISKLIATIILPFVLSASCTKKAEPPKNPPVPVIVSTVMKKTVPVQITAIGNAEAYSTIQVKSQITGELMKVHFRQGQEVKKGELLFTIDPRPYEAMVKQAEAALAKDIAQMEYARAQAQRYSQLMEKGYVSRDQYEQFRTNASAAEAVVNADRAAVENAKLQLKYCFIYSPISGKTGTLISTQGNLIKANADNPLVTIQQLEPMYVNFAVPEQRLAEIRKQMAAGSLGLQANVPGREAPAEGTLTFIDNVVDLTTGTIKMKGSFPNKDRGLWPGQYTDVVLTLSTQPDAVLAPSAAIQTGQKGQYAFVVKEDHTVEMRPVSVDRTMGDLSVIRSGLTPGETVVTDGQLRLAPGAAVEVRKPEPATGAALEKHAPAPSGAGASK